MRFTPRSSRNTGRKFWPVAKRVSSARMRLIVQTMLTVVTQNSRPPGGSALSGDRMAFGFGYPHCSVPGARCQVMPRPLMHNIVRIGDSFCRAYWWRSCPERTEARHRPQIKGGPFDRDRRRCDAARYRQGMKKPVLGIIGGAALLAAVPLSFQCRNGA